MISLQLSFKEIWRHICVRLSLECGNGIFSQQNFNRSMSECQQCYGWVQAVSTMNRQSSLCISTTFTNISTERSSFEHCDFKGQNISNMINWLQLVSSFTTKDLYVTIIYAVGVHHIEKAYSYVLLPLHRDARLNWSNASILPVIPMRGTEVIKWRMSNIEFIVEHHSALNRVMMAWDTITHYLINQL